MFKFLDQSFGALALGMICGGFIAYAGFAVDTIRAVVPPVALGLFFAFSLATLFVSLSAQVFETLTMLAKLTAMFFLVYFVLTYLGMSGEVNEQAAALMHGIFLITPWIAVAVSLMFLLFSIGEARTKRRVEEMMQQAQQQDVQVRHAQAPRGRSWPARRLHR